MATHACSTPAFSPPPSINCVLSIRTAHLLPTSLSVGHFSYYSNAPGPNPPPRPPGDSSTYLPKESPSVYQSLSLGLCLLSTPPHSLFPSFQGQRLVQKVPGQCDGERGCFQSVGWGRHPAMLEGVRQHPGASQTLSLPNRAPLACPTPSLPPAQ